MVERVRYEIEAFNTATESENRIHDDGIAKRFGFQGGLVPGVDVYAYMTRAAVLVFGESFLRSGIMDCRFGQPVYDGETIAVTGQLDHDGLLKIELTGRNATLATATARPGAGDPVPGISRYPTTEMPGPDDRPPAGPDSLKDGQALGTLREATDADSQRSYRRDVRETLELYEAQGIVHPGYLLRRANSALKDNVLLGPWIHVGSTVTHFSVLRAGEPLETRSRVDRLYDHKGHGFVDLNVALFSGDRAIARIAHVAIYEPRQVRVSA
ncbi:hypothetical protein [Minwuia sp.]|uniref:hypothetical protein n=1 Tax=Minwuia sp. TaxID=2493630 RepID=UPI003A937CA8